MAGVGLTPHGHLRGADKVCVWVRVSPRSTVQSQFDCGAHELVIGGVVADLVDTVAVAVVGSQDGRVLLGQIAPLLGLRASGADPDAMNLFERVRCSSRCSASRIGAYSAAS
ncbi:hypothetical protein GCM10020255_039230 [Rhodococcus baikonurensis]